MLDWNQAQMGLDAILWRAAGVSSTAASPHVSGLSASEDGDHFRKNRESDSVYRVCGDDQDADGKS